MFGSLVPFERRPDLRKIDGLLGDREEVGHVLVPRRHELEPPQCLRATDHHLALGRAVDQLQPPPAGVVGRSARSGIDTPVPRSRSRPAIPSTLTSPLSNVGASANVGCPLVVLRVRTRNPRSLRQRTSASLDFAGATKSRSCQYPGLPYAATAYPPMRPPPRFQGYASKSTRRRSVAPPTVDHGSNRLRSHTSTGPNG